HPDIAALGAKDGFMLSGLAIDDNDPLARRDQGLEFLDVTAQVAISHAEYDAESDRLRLTNSGPSVIDTHLIVVLEDLPRGVRLLNASGTTKEGAPYRRVFLPEGVLNPGESVLVRLQLKGNHDNNPPYTLRLFSGQGR